MSNYHKTDGGLWPNKDKKAPKQPDKTGKIKVTREQIKGLIAMAKKGEEPVLKLAAWDRKAQDTGAPYQYVTGEVYWDGEESAAPPPPPPVKLEPVPMFEDEDDIPF